MGAQAFPRRAYKDKSKFTCNRIISIAIAAMNKKKVPLQSIEEDRKEESPSNVFDEGYHVRTKLCNPRPPKKCSAKTPPKSTSSL